MNKKLRTMGETGFAKAGWKDEQGLTLVETLFALAVAGIALAGVAAFNLHQLRLVKSVRDTNAASLCLQDRVEQLRVESDWRRITSASYMTGSLFAAAPASAPPKPNASP